MRATTNQCLILAWLIIFPGMADAQISRFFKRTSDVTRQTHIPGAARNVVDGAVKQVQFEAAVPDAVVPSPLTEATVPSLGIPNLDVPSAALEYGSSFVAPPAETIAPPPPGMAAGEIIADPIGEPIYNSPPATISDSFAQESIVDSGFGQPYDIPIGDVIPQAAETYSSGNWFRGGNWYSRQQVVMLLRADLPHQHIAIDNSIPTVLGAPNTDPNAGPSLSTKDTDFTFEAGTRLTIGHRIGRDPANRDHSIEFTFFGLFDYTGRASLASTTPGLGLGITSYLASVESTFSSLSGLGSLGFANVNPIPGLVANTRADVLHQADLNSFELNYVLGARPAKDRLVMQPDGRWVRHATPSKVRGLFAGLRYVRQNDLFQYRGIGEDFNNQAPDLDTGATYIVTTDNDLVGIQIGGEFVHKRTDWAFGLRGKVGGYINFADRMNHLSQTQASAVLVDGVAGRVVETTISEQNLSDETLTFLGEGNIYLAYSLRPNTTLQIGYDVLYMNGVATATNNLGIRGGTDVDRETEFARFELTGDSLYHGMNAGFEFTW